MTVTKPQAQMLATLAAACRPHGARRWDTAGTMAALLKLHDRDLASVIMATIRAARDRDVDNPGVVPTAGPHWAERLAPAAFVPNVLDSSERCSICGKSEPSCRVTTDISDHEFESAAMAAKRRAEADPAAVQGAIAALKDEIAATPDRAPPAAGLEDYADRNPELRARVDALRAALPQGPPMRESEPEPTEPTAEPEETSA